MLNLTVADVAAEEMPDLSDGDDEDMDGDGEQWQWMEEDSQPVSCLFCERWGCGETLATEDASVAVLREICPVVLCAFVLKTFFQNKSRPKKSLKSLFFDSLLLFP